ATGETGATGGTGGHTPVLRPESASYAANAWSANHMFNMTLHDRIGESGLVKTTAEDELASSLWIRSTGKRTESNSSGQLDTRIYDTTIELGGDIARWDTNQQRYHLGLMAGYGNSNNKTTSSVTDYQSKGKLSGYSVGMYLTWFENALDNSGWYTDSWLRWNDFNASVSGDQLSKEDYKLRGITGSLESGYAWRVAGNDKTSFWLTPQAQVTYLGVTSNDFTEKTGTNIKGNKDAVESRLGVRASTTTHTSGTFIQPYVELNYRNLNRLQSPNLDGQRAAAIGGKNSFETKAGVETTISDNTRLWANVSYVTGNKDFNSYQGMIGINVKF
ncbi:TPA: autotransporter outer membrane beta-barrel domain-containing protein, partial [Escherichia coli]|nr:autotransporter outer membrane beta-barrel domain-containing protein [Escherichia coli]